MRSLFALCALVALAPLATAQPRHDGVYAYPWGVCGSIYVTSRAVQAYAEPRAVGAPIRQVDAGRRVEPNDVTETLTVVLSPGVSITRQAFEPGEAGFTIPRGTRVELFGEAGDGAQIFRVGGTMHTAYAGLPSDAASVTADTRRLYTIESFPRVEVWVRLRARPGKPAAWLNTSQPGIRWMDAMEDPRFAGMECT